MIVELLIIVVTLGAALLLYIKNAQKYYEKMGVPTPPISFPLGNSPAISPEIIFQKKNICDVCIEQARLLKDETFYGCYFNHVHAIVVKDPELVKTVTVKDFSHFVDRNSVGTKKVFSGRHDKAWAKQMTNLSGDEWKNTRSTFTPIFTSGKMKGMVSFIAEITERLENAFAEKIE